MLTFAIGDPHGCHDKLVGLLGRCRDYAADRPHRFVFIGDYIDRGPDSKAVVQHLMNLDHTGGGHVFLRGNHEQKFLDTLVDPAALGPWLAFGGDATLESYGARQPEQIDPEHIAWLATRPLTHDDGLRLFVHAGVNPANPLDDQSGYDLIWIREPFLSSTVDFGRLIVHGHTPTKDGAPEIRANRVNVDTGAVFGRALTAAVFDDSTRDPLAMLQQA